MKILILLLLSLPLTSFVAEASYYEVNEIEDTASGFEPVVDTQLKVLGRGVKDKNSNESLALACIGDQESTPGLPFGCEKLRFVYYKSPTEVFFVGKTYQATQLSEKDLKSYIDENLKTEVNVYRTKRSRENFSSEDYRNLPESVKAQVSRSGEFRFYSRIAGTVLIFGGIGGAIFAGALAGLAPPIVLGGFVALLVAGAVTAIVWKNREETYSLVKHREVKRVRIEHDLNATQQLFNTNGWNWVNNPVSLKSRRFHKMLDMIQAKAQ